MSSPTPALHIYAREIKADERTSLSVLAAHIQAGARVLDLGCGSGAIGRFLRERDGAATGPIDGLTISADEAALAAPTYRRVEVADLDGSQLTEMFPSHAYDVIVCADVLEHIRRSDRVLAECRHLLADGGRVLLSIPNAGYSGLIAELMAGEFRYRPEGLLDETHLRFFTRRTLMRFLRDNGWVAEQVDTVERQLPDSEFRVAFDALPPPVARHLLASPDSLTYQFIVVGRPLMAGEQPMELPSVSAPLPAQALFTSQLYLGVDGQFTEERKLTRSGVIGQPQQSLQFALPADTPLTCLKLDPADRPGFMHLNALTLRGPDGQVAWEWTPADAEPMINARMDGIVVQPPIASSGSFTLLLHGSDPWIELPIPAELVLSAQGGTFEADVGWPMSADYLALAGATEQRVSAAQTEAVAALKQRDAIRDELNAQTNRTLDERNARQRLEQQNEHLRVQKLGLIEHTHALSRERDEARQLVHDIENSTVFRVTRPIVNAKMRVDRLLGIGSARPASNLERPEPQPIKPSEQPIDIIVPVYRGLEDTQRCLESVLASRNQAQWQLVVINDASPEPAVTAWLREFAQRDDRIVLLENDQNLGFVGTVNRGMSLSDEHDVLLLNSDTEVAGNWLDRIQAAAHGDRKIASVTPFSNNATICSYPRFCQDNDLPAGWDTARLDAVFARVNAGQVVDVPTGVGFCMYIRRAALQQVGLFDVEHFGKGYGEENDFCVRASDAGWRNLHLLDTFVRHFGGVSFGDSKSPRERAAMETLRRLHPRYESAVLHFVREDPARLARTAVDLARIVDGKRPVILAVLHDRAGGTERHVIELAQLLGDRAQFLVLRPTPGHRLSLNLPGANEGFELEFRLPTDEDALVDLLRLVGVRHVHFHHLLGHGEFVQKLPTRLGVSYDFTAHDFYPICPQITLTDRTNGYCGELGVQQCTECLAHSPAPDGSDILSWRSHNTEVLDGARHVIAPARDVLRRLLEMAPAAPVRLVPHTDISPGQPVPEPVPTQLKDDRPLRVAVIGALSIIKGADVLEDVAVAARKQNAPVDFHLIGYGYRTLKTQPHARLTVHGRYDEKDLPDLLRWLEPDLVWFPALWPETYSYTLSACLLGGWPVVAPDLGAFAERLSGRRWSWVRPWKQSAQQWLEFFRDVREHHFATGHAPKPVILLADDAALARTRGFDSQPPTWYMETYLVGLRPPTAETIPIDKIKPYLPASTASAGTKSQALNLLVRLRALPVLGPVARAIPLRWQTRVKSWLRR